MAMPISIQITCPDAVVTNDGDLRDVGSLNRAPSRATMRHFKMPRKSLGEPLCAARGHFVHVYVDRATRRPVAALPDSYLTALRALELP